MHTDLHFDMMKHMAITNQIRMSFPANLLAVLLIVPAVLAVDHVVGGNSGWTTGVDFGSWAAGETFIVGDTLLFGYDSSHTVEVVDKDGYDNCDPTKATDSFQDGNTTVSLPKSGSIFFICSTAGHCSFSGMKLAITVKDSSNSSTPPPVTPSPPTTTPPPPLNRTSAPPSSPTTPDSASAPGTPTATSAPPSPPNAASQGLGKLSYLMLVLMGGAGTLFVW